MPIPFNGAACGLPGASDATLTAPTLAPKAVGEKLTLIVHDASAGRVAPQLFDCAKSPVAVMEAMLRVVPPAFCSVNSCAAEVDPRI